MATNQLARSVGSPEALETQPSYPWPMSDSAERGEGEFGEKELGDFVEQQLSLAYLELRGGIRPLESNSNLSLASQLRGVASRKLFQLRTLWPVLQLGEIRSLRERDAGR